MGKRECVRKKPKCPKCINPDLAPFYDVGLMKACYIRKSNGSNYLFIRIGYICEKHGYFLPDEK